MALTIDLNGKVALVTGVSQGIGLGIAGAFAEAGAKISGCGTSDGAGFITAMEERQAEALYTSCDITQEAAINTLVQRTIERFGRIDVLVSNAGRNMFWSASCTEDQWQENLSLNLY